MMLMDRKRLAIAVAGVLSLGTSSVQAVDFGASTTMQSSLAVTVVNDFDISTVFATETAAKLRSSGISSGRHLMLARPNSLLLLAVLEQ